MRKHENRRWLRLLAIGILAYCCACKCAYSAEVSSSEAQEAVQGWATLREALTGAARFGASEISGVATYEGLGGTGTFHVVSFAGGGYAVTSGDTEVTPILAYSEEGEFVASEENPLWVMLMRDVSGRIGKLGNGEQGTGNRLAAKSAKSGGSQSLATGNATERVPPADAWARLRKAAVTPTKPILKAGYASASSVSDLRVGPLCETRWSQSNAKGGLCYNYYTPSNYVCGCGATAFAQIMKFFEWPKVKVSVGDHWYTKTVNPPDADAITWRMGVNPETGETYPNLDPVFTGPEFGGPYDWDNMPANPESVDNLTDVQRQAIGQLTRDCGISMRMQYTSSGSSSSGYTIKLRLIDQFGYANAEVIHEKGNSAPELEPELARKAMLSSFDFGSPCAVDIETGSGGGHEIVGDGYGYSDGRLYIHFNFGWGSHSATAWYTPSENGESNLSVIRGIVYNIWTPEMCAETNRTIVSGRVLGVGGVPVSEQTVIATDKKTGATFSATSNGNGIYALLLPPETTYEIETAKDGYFAKATRRVERCVSNRLTEKVNGSVSYSYNIGETVANQPGVDLTLSAEAAEYRWLDESALSAQWTGEWSDGIEYGDDGRAYLYGSNSFTPFLASTGNLVTVEFKARFDEVTIPEEPGVNAQAAVRLSTNGCFQVWTRLRQGYGGQAGNGWVDVAADGVTPVSGTEYTFRTILNYGERTYSVDVLSSEQYRPLAASDTTSFPLASASNAVSRIAFKGETQFTSLVGDSRYEIIGFAADDALVLSNNVQIVLDAAKAAWLNSCAGGRDALVASAAGLSSKEFNDAYLLNLDITDGGRSYTFEVTDIDVGADSVEISVTLTRTGVVTDGATAAPINGTLKFYGAATLEAFKMASEPLSSQTLVDDDFSDGDTATATFPKGDNVFFKAKIEGP